LYRQNIVSRKDDTIATQERVSLEALGYPNTYLANKARLRAIHRMWRFPNRLPERVALCNQIINSSEKHDEAQLAQAISEKIWLVGGDFSTALIHLRKARPPHSFEFDKRFDWFINGSQIAEAAVDIGIRAIRCGDVVCAKEAMKIAIEEPLDKSAKADISKLQAEIKSFENVLKLNKERALQRAKHRPAQPVK
jgi:hypothetical protein